ncbi:Ser/Thr protein kinase RdoA (MazF antagonist) [Palleronia aestuarii]|uniref:Ser/Thr protein kinase RdoA (MazF antagonist) n=1 Tax=Palleronia aestuarii TaxID=568105 RepID=A0A2W7MY03_9RHOB|nr:phosphotransferase [Palleronia aestuarii]PZX12878.1 Ser/Thr protein kinase RdoA (MazF antagonist) [Palleronia aestuarii]
MLYDDAFLALLSDGVRRVLPEWGLPPDTPLRLLTVSENATYLAEPPSGTIALRVQRPGYNTEAAIRSELDWLAALRSDEVVRAAAPIPLERGGFLARFDAGGVEMLVAAFEFLPGAPPDEVGDLTAWFDQLGEMTGRMHHHARTWPKPQGFTRRTWDWEHCIGPEADWGDWRAGRDLDAAGLAVIGRAVDALRAETQAFGRSAQTWGLIHADMRPGNLIAHEDRLAVIDFDDCGWSWFMLDFAASVSLMECDPRYDAFLGNWLEGYRRATPLSAANEAMIPSFVMIRRIQLTAWAVSHAETPFGQRVDRAFAEDTVALAERYLTHHA